ncbi:MAG: hypothetical protein Q4G13_09165 [Moraxella sp.]|nr:hypothetical protein [Moraxella sp.]
MIPVLLIVGAGAAILGAAVAVYWKNIRDWLKRVLDKLPSSIKEKIQGVQVFAQRIGNTFKNIMKYYSYDKNTNQWNETVVTTEVDASTVPEHIRRKIENASNETADISDDLEKELKMSF